MWRKQPLPSVRQLDDVPQMDPGAPMPVVLADEGRLDVIYLAADNAPWDGTTLKLMSPDHAADVVWITMGAMIFKFGHPNDEALGGHPLFKLGLKHYACNEVLDSAWPQELIRINSPHPRHSDSMFSDLRHLIFAFHDSTLEVLTDGWRIRTREGSINTVATEAARELFSPAPHPPATEIIT